MRLLVLMAQGFVILTLSANPVLALNCVPGRDPHDEIARHVGAVVPVSGLRGVSANIEEYSPYYSGKHTGGTNASIMMNSTLEKYVQLGWKKSKSNLSSTTREAWLQMSWGPANPGNKLNRFFGPEPIGQMTWYEIITDGSNNYDFFIGGVWAFSANKPITPGTVQYFGETHDLVDQMPGIAADKVKFSGTAYFQIPGTTFHNMTSPFSTGWTDLYDTSNTGTTHYIWDQCT